MKKIYQSSELIKKKEQLRLKDIENRKFKQFSSHYYNVANIKEKISDKKKKEKVKYETFKDNISHINRSYYEKNEDLFNKLSDKYKKQIDNKNAYQRFIGFIHKRKISFDRFNENSFNLSLNRINSSMNQDIMRFQHQQNSKSFIRNKSLDVSREYIK